jgi:hypothetical protein
MAGRKLRGVEDARACMREVARSGLTRRDWAVAHGLDARSLHVWDMRLRREDAPMPRPLPVLRAATTPRRQDTGEPLRFVELVAEAAAAEPATYRLVVGCVRIEVDEGFSEAVLTRLLRVVTACSA